MIKLFSLIFYLCLPLQKESPAREGIYVETPLNTQISAQTHLEIKVQNRINESLVVSDSCDNYPNKCPHICLHLLVKQHPSPRGQG